MESDNSINIQYKNKYAIFIGDPASEFACKLIGNCIRQFGKKSYFSK
jgi:hypothetical protein